MISVALPWVLGGAFVAASGIVGLHFLSVRRPPTLLLPTARFVPERDVRAVSRTAKPSDVWLLVLRVAAVFAAGAAIAGLQWRTSTPQRGVVVVVDRGVLGDSVSWRRTALSDTATVSTRVRVALVPARHATINDGASASVFAIARREAEALREQGVDSIDLHVLAVAPPSAADLAWRSWRAAWPGRVTLHVPPPPEASAKQALPRAVVLVRDSDVLRDDDVVRWALRQRGVRVWRASDALSGSVSVRIEWPTRAIPDGWHAVGDSADALVAGGRVVRGAWRVASLPDTGAWRVDSTLRAIAWWSDGRVAATESRAGTQCRRVLSATVDASSDVLLSASASGLLEVLSAPCRAPVTVATAALSHTIADGTAMASAAALDPATSADARGTTREPPSSWLSVALLGTALALLLVEWRVRDRGDHAPNGSGLS